MYYLLFITGCKRFRQAQQLVDRYQWRYQPAQRETTAGHHWWVSCMNLSLILFHTTPSIKILHCNYVFVVNHTCTESDKLCIFRCLFPFLSVIISLFLIFYFFIRYRWDLSGGDGSHCEGCVPAWRPIETRYRLSRQWFQVINGCLY